MPRTQSRSISVAEHTGTYIDLSHVTPAFAPLPAVSEALAQVNESILNRYEVLVHARLVADYRLNERNLALIPDLESARAEIVARSQGPVVLFPPFTADNSLCAALRNREVVQVARGFGRHGMLPLEFASDLPHDGLAIIASPSDPFGGLLAANDAVRLARACRWLVIDERFADYAGQSLLGLASEFQNVVVLRSFRARVGPTSPEPGWAIGSARTGVLTSGLATGLLPATAEAAIAAMSDLPAVRAILSQVRDERSRLFRLLRKLSYLQPLPSWGPFVAARVEVGARDVLLSLLSARGINVHAPSEQGLERYVRIGIGSRSEMECLRRALLFIAPAMLGAQLASGGTDTDRLALRGEELGETQFSQVEERRQRSA